MGVMERRLSEADGTAKLYPTELVNYSVSGTSRPRAGQDANMSLRLW
jgi:hypothetical protein